MEQYTQGQLDEMVLDYFMGKASDLNDEGVEAQIHFLANQGIISAQSRTMLNVEQAIMAKYPDRAVGYNAGPIKSSIHTSDLKFEGKLVRLRYLSPSVKGTRGCIFWEFLENC